MTTSTDRIKKNKVLEELKAARSGYRSAPSKDHQASQSKDKRGEPSTKARGKRKNKFGKRMGKPAIRGRK